MQRLRQSQASKWLSDSEVAEMTNQSALACIDRPLRRPWSCGRGCSLVVISPRGTRRFRRGALGMPRGHPLGRAAPRFPAARDWPPRWPAFLSACPCPADQLGSKLNFFRAFLRAKIIIHNRRVEYNSKNGWARPGTLSNSLALSGTLVCGSPRLYRVSRGMQALPARRPGGGGAVCRAGGAVHRRLK